MAEVHLPFSLLPMVDDQESLRVEGATAGEVLSELQSRYPRLSGWVLDERGQLRQHVALFRDGERIDAEAAVGDGLCLHTICPWPDDPDRLAVGCGSPTPGEPERAYHDVLMADALQRRGSSDATDEV